jgi:hypothetical protein
MLTRRAVGQARRFHRATQIERLTRFFLQTDRPSQAANYLTDLNMDLADVSSNVLSGLGSSHCTGGADVPCNPDPQDADDPDFIGAARADVSSHADIHFHGPGQFTIDKFYLSDDACDSHPVFVEVHADYGDDHKFDRTNSLDAPRARSVAWATPPGPGTRSSTSGFASASGSRTASTSAPPARRSRAPGTDPDPRLG